MVGGIICLSFRDLVSTNTYKTGADHITQTAVTPRRKIWLRITLNTNVTVN